jgi:hypothetical protein
MAEIDDPKAIDPARQRKAWSVLCLVALGVLVVGLLRIPQRADGTGTLDECLWGYPIVTFDGTAIQLPVMSWPTGLAYDADRHVILDAARQTIAMTGAHLTVRGTIRDMRGADIPPCFASRGIDIERLALD